jgi:hypothetical protein
MEWLLLIDPARGINARSRLEQSTRTQATLGRFRPVTLRRELQTERIMNGYSAGFPQDALLS